MLCVAFALPIVGFSLREYVVAHQFSLAPAAGSTIYGRLAESADCATLKLPPYERAVCPPRALAIRLGPDGLVHSATSPDHTYVAPPGLTHGEVIGNFEHRVITQQPLRVVAGVLGDAARLFELHRVTSTGDTPISRWQFQTSYPTYGSSIFLSRDHTIMLGLHFAASGGPVHVRPLPASMGGQATVDRPLAAFLRGYQLHGGYTPGPLLALATLAGLAGTVIALAGGLAGPGGADSCPPASASWPWPACCSSARPWPSCSPPTCSSSPGATSCPLWSPCRRRARWASPCWAACCAAAPLQPTPRAATELSPGSSLCPGRRGQPHPRPHPASWATQGCAELRDGRGPSGLP